MLFIMRMQNKRQSHGPQTEMQILEKSAYVGKKSTSMRYARMSASRIQVCPGTGHQRCTVYGKGIYEKFRHRPYPGTDLGRRVAGRCEVGYYVTNHPRAHCLPVATPFLPRPSPDPPRLAAQWARCT